MIDEVELCRQSFKPGQVPADKALLKTIIDRAPRVEQRGRGIVRAGPKELEYVEVRIYVEREA